MNSPSGHSWRKVVLDSFKLRECRDLEIEIYAAKHTWMRSEIGTWCMDHIRPGSLVAYWQPTYHFGTSINNHLKMIGELREDDIWYLKLKWGDATLVDNL
jgi:hypothetical protein